VETFTTKSCVLAARIAPGFQISPPDMAAAGRPTKFMLTRNRDETGGGIKAGFHLGFAARPYVVSLEVDES
jgi:hypothetical protein